MNADLSAIIAEVLHFARTGEGNGFIRSFFACVVQPRLED